MAGTVQIRGGGGRGVGGGWRRDRKALPGMGREAWGRNGPGFRSRKEPFVRSPRREGRKLKQVTDRSAADVGEEHRTPNLWVPKAVSMKCSGELGSGVRPVQG